MDIKEYLDLADINFGNEDEILNAISNPKFIQTLEKEALALGDFVSSERPNEVFAAEERTAAIAIVDIRCRNDLERCVLNWILSRYELQQKLGPVSFLEAKWMLWNEFDPLCNPELLLPYWKISLLYA